jgi:hypothetical protein
MGQLAVKDTRTQIARPLRVLVPLIKQSLARIDGAGLEFKRETGALLIETKDSDQVSRGSWGAWLNRHFHLSARTAQEYMQLARKMGEPENRGAAASSLREVTGHTARDREHRDARRPLFEAMAEVDVEALTQQKQTRQDEVKLHRELAEELIDIGYKALATRLHPDRGGSKDAMARLNRVREELRDVAATRRFV